MQNDQRQIIAFMAFAVAFALIGHTAKSHNVAGGDAKIVLGGGIGTVLLVLLSEAGDPGEMLAKGLAAITMISSVLINGTPVFSAVSNLTSKSSPTPQLVTTKG